MRARTVIGWLGMGLVGAGALVVVAAGGLLGGAVDTATAEDRVGKADWHRTEADIKVYKTATCGCCSSWVEHLRRSGFEVEAVDVGQERLYDMKRAVGLTRDLASCHTAFIDGY